MNEKELIYEGIETAFIDYKIRLSNMDCFICNILEGNLVLKEHEASQ